MHRLCRPPAVSSRPTPSQLHQLGPQPGPRPERDAARGRQEHPGTLDLLSCEAKSSGDRGPGACPQGGGVRDLAGTRWRTKKGGGSLQCGGKERKVRPWKRERWWGLGQRSGCWWKDSTEEGEVVADVEQEQLSSQEPEEKLEQERARPGTPSDLLDHTGGAGVTCRRHL